MLLLLLLLRVLLLLVLTPLSLEGAYFYGWTADPTNGGEGDMTFSPYGKPAESVLRSFFTRGEFKLAPDKSLLAPLPPPDSHAALVSELEAQTAKYVRQGRQHAELSNYSTAAGERNTLNGYVFGLGEWTHPETTVTQAKLSLDSLAATGANSVEFTPMWFFDSQNATTMYVI